MNELNIVDNYGKIRYDRTVEHLVATGRLEHMLKADELLRKFNNLPLIAQEEQAAIIQDLFGSVGENPSVSRGFQCDFGSNIFVGDNFMLDIIV